MDKTEKPLLLFVDDSKVMRLAADKMLGGEFRVEVAEDGLQAWTIISQNPAISVVFSDLAMPEMDGYALLEKIRTSDDDGIAGLPVIIVTGAENDEEARTKALRLGGTDFISKPFNSTDLLARARAHSHYQQERKELARQAMIDPLTRLGNRRYLQHRLKQELALSSRQQTALSVVQIEVYQFNQLFVQLGKRRADMVLMKLAQVLRSVVRKEDSLARSSVAQFTVLLPSARAEGALRFVDRAMKVSEKLAFQHRGKAQRLPLNIAVHTPSSLGNSSPGQVGKVLEEYMKNARNGGANAVVSDGDEARQQPDARPVLTVEQALALLQSGKEHVVVNALPDLKRQLMPLLQLMRRESTGRETV
ncbi:diguanylate cyclase [Alcanivorax sp. P2S70]|uniref:Diguanylate cyclase response regulator n=1 Tax=Alcanivorax profundi TaxID=2338368 RepID=A0A418Y3R2_9GAMM|nr:MULTISPECIES: diguanylate cyclase [Alcanivorax]ERP86628.1 diguanylate cyclase [Alcanivorax sp. P2S70]RJG20182.1 diguanylate cyclase response regulator [Alcanivorax profundi]